MMLDRHIALGAVLGALGPVEIPFHYGNTAAEYHAIKASAALLDVSYRSRLVLLGADRLKFLNGQVTNNVKDLRAGSGVYAALVTAKAKIQSDLNIYALPEELLLDFEPGLSQVVQERLEKYIVADDVQIADAAPHYGMLTFQGPQAGAAVAALRLSNELPAQPMAVVAVDDPQFGQLYLANRPRTGSTGYELYAPTAAMGELLDKATAAVGKVGGSLAGWEALETARIEAGIPRFGQDMDETNLAPEAGIEPVAISYNKGCYIGQEIISRLKAFGQLAKSLRRLELSSPVAAVQFPAKGSKLFKEGKEVGYLTSSAVLPASGRVVGLGYVRKEHWDAGSELTLRSGENETTARVLGLPFGGS